MRRLAPLVVLFATAGCMIFASSATTSTAAASASADAMPSGDLPGWRQVFSDDFTQPLEAGQFPAAVSSRWSAYADGWDRKSAAEGKSVDLSGGRIVTKKSRTVRVGVHCGV